MPESDVRVQANERCLIVSEREDDELTVLAQCVAALKTLDDGTRARVVAYLNDRFER